MSSKRTSRPPSVPLRPHLTPLMYSLPVRRLREILNRVVPDVALGPVDELPSTQLARLYTLSMSDGRRILLSFAPSLAVRLLRHEATMLSSEATLIDFLSGTLRPKEEEVVELPICRTEPCTVPTLLRGLVPKLLKHSSNNREMAYPYSLFESRAGAPLSTLSIDLTPPERHLVDKQVGSMARKLASVTSPSGYFGTVTRVLPDPFVPKSVTLPETNGSTTWSEAFNFLLEGIFRDGEDMAVLLPYEILRAHFQRLSYRLNAVRTPRLLVLDAGNETNALVERISEVGSLTAPCEGVRLMGLRSWSQGVFGDPLLSNCFEDPTKGFLEGWQEGGADIIEDSENSETRLLLYRCFRAVVTIVTEYYRPQGDSSRKEMEGRRTLTSALAELERVEGGLRKRSRSSSTESGCCKKQRIKIEDAL